MSRVVAVAREDIRHALQDRLVWAAIVLLGLMFLPSTASVAATRGRPIDELLLLLPYDLITFALVVVAAVGYASVVGEREDGTIRFVLGLPGTRRDLVLGKLLSRTAIVVFALTVTLAIANALIANGYGEPYLVSFWTMGIWILLYGAVWTAVTVGYSAAFSSPYRTLGALVVTYAAFSPDVGVWGVIVRPVFAFMFTRSFAAPTYEDLSTAPLWMRVTERFNPITAFWEALRWSVEAVGPGTPTGSAAANLLGAVAFLAFGAIGLAFGYRRFDRTDLGDGGSGFRLGDLLWRSFHGMWTAITKRQTKRRPQTNRSQLQAIVREDIRHALQNWVVMGGIVVTVLLVGPSLWQGLDPSSVSTTTEELAEISDTFSLPVLALGIAVGYRAVVGERENGTARLLLGLPATRRDLVVGKVFSRVVIAVLTLIPLLLFVEILLVVRFGSAYLPEFLALGGWALTYAVVWTSAVVGISATVKSRYRALAAIFGTYLLFSSNIGLWGPVVRPLFAFVFTGQSSTEKLVQSVQSGPLWYRYSDHLNPFVALRTVENGLFTVAGVGTGRSVDALLIAYSVLVCLLFATIPVYVGYRRFGRSNLR